MARPLNKILFHNFVMKAPSSVRHKSKRHPQWYQFRRPTEPHEIAKEFFDDLYGKRFGKDWPSIRCAMLSRKKYAAILNTFADVDDVEHKLCLGGATDIVAELRNKAAEQLENTKHQIKLLNQELHRVTAPYSNIPEVYRDQNLQASHEPVENLEAADLSLSSIQNEIAERLGYLESRCVKYTELAQICRGLQVYSYPKCDLTEFADPLAKKHSNSILDYFLLDGSSILPILALNPKPNDHILDMCAAPGGKFMCVMQVSKNGNGCIVANDVKSTRANRLRKIRDEYIPKDASIYRNIKIVALDARDWGESETGMYDRVLADVPCTTDRHSMLPTFTQRDNIFSQLRKRERASLPMLQMDILTNAILACRPGGTVVYSTCTASMQQNEYVVQMTIQQMLTNQGIVCEIEDLTDMTALLGDHFHFLERIEVGSMVVPFLDANFGPTYVCKILRTN